MMRYAIECFAKQAKERFKKKKKTNEKQRRAGKKGNSINCWNKIVFFILRFGVYAISI